MKHVNLGEFNSHSLRSAWSNNQSLVGATESRLREISNEFRTDPADWNIQSAPWLTESLHALQSEGEFEKIQIEESISPERSIFVYWLVKKSCSPSQEIASAKYGIASFSSLFRRRQIYSLLEGKTPNLKYINADEIQAELAQLLNLCAEMRPISKLMTAIALSAGLVAIHPFSDENGRSARLLLREYLRENGVWRHHNLPIGFLIYRDRSRFLARQNGLFVEGDWNNYIQYMLSLIMAAAELAVAIKYVEHKKMEMKIHQK